MMRYGRALLLLFALLHVTHAHARPAPADDAAAAYRAAIERAVAEHQQGNWLEARALFREAHALSPNARTLMGLGMVEFELHHYVAAQSYLASALASDQEPLDAPQRARMQQLLTDTHSFVALLPVQLRPAQARIEVNGVVVTPDAEGRLHLDIGHHTLLVSSEGHQSAAYPIQLEAGGLAPPLVASLIPIAAVSALEVKAPAKPMRAASTDDAKRRQRAWGTATLVVGSTTLAIAAGLLGGALYAARHSDHRGDARATRAHHTAIAADILGAVSVPLLVTGAVLRLRTRRREAVTLTWSVRACGESPAAALHVKGDF